MCVHFRGRAGGKEGEEKEEGGGGNSFIPFITHTIPCSSHERPLNTHCVCVRVSQLWWCWCYLLDLCLFWRFCSGNQLLGAVLHVPAGLFTLLSPSPLISSLPVVPLCVVASYLLPITQSEDYNEQKRRCWLVCPGQGSSSVAVFSFCGGLLGTLDWFLDSMLSDWDTLKHW